MFNYYKLFNLDNFYDYSLTKSNRPIYQIFGTSILKILQIRFWLKEAGSNSSGGWIFEMIFIIS